jgi:glycerol kinase
MSANPVFVSALASATQRPVEISPVREATTLGAAFSAGLAVGIWSGDEEIAATWRPTQVIEPRSALNRDRWSEAVQRSENWIPALSGLEF